MLIQDHRQMITLELESLASATAVVTWRLDLHRRQDLDDRGRHLTVFRDDGLDRPDDLDHRRDRGVGNRSHPIRSVAEAALAWANRDADGFPTTDLMDAVRAHEKLRHPYKG
jgi:hypothetical protein